MKEYGKQILVSVIAAIFVFGVGYALLSDTITVTGTATTTGSLDVKIIEASCTAQSGAVSTENNRADKSNGDNTVTLTVPALEYPGASATFTVKLRNVGSLDAKLKSITPTGVGAAGTEGLVVTYNGLTVDSTTVVSNPGNDVNKDITFTVTVTWDETSTTSFSNSQFSIILLFEQVTPA